MVSLPLKLVLLGMVVDNSSQPGAVFLEGCRLLMCLSEGMTDLHG